MSADCIECGECLKTHDIGTIDCGDGFAEMPMTATMTGTYTAVFRYLGALIPFEFEGTAGQPLLVPITGVNENMRHTIYIVDPDGDKVLWGVYDCFRFILNKELTPSRFAIGCSPCEPCEPTESCLYTVLVSINEELTATYPDLDPCEEHTLNITVNYV